MGGSSGSGGGSTTTKPPQWWTDAAKYAVGQGRKTAEIGYVPYIGPDVAAFAPQQVDAMQQSADWSSAFNTPGQAAPRIADSIMPSTDFGGGLKGYSSFPGYQDALAALAKQYPGLYSYINAFFPHTAQPDAPSPVPTPTPTPTPGPGPSPVPTPGPGSGPGTGGIGGPVGRPGVGNLGLGTPQWLMALRRRLAAQQGGGGGSGGGSPAIGSRYGSDMGGGFAGGLY